MCESVRGVRPREVFAALVRTDDPCVLQSLVSVKHCSSETPGELSEK